MADASVFGRENKHSGNIDGNLDITRALWGLVLADTHRQWLLEPFEDQFYINDVTGKSLFQYTLGHCLVVCDKSKRAATSLSLIHISEPTRPY